VTPWLVALLVLAPLAATNMLSSAGVLSGADASAIRLLCQLILCCILAIHIAFAQNSLAPDTTPPYKNRTVQLGAVFFVVMGCLATTSTVLNSTNTSARARTLAVLIFSFNTLILAPALALRYRRPERFLIAIQRSFVAISIIVLCTVTAVYFSSSHPGWIRLGYPLSAGVFAHYMLVSLVLVLSTMRSRALAITFSIAILFSGSRTAIALGALVIVVLNSRRYKTFLIAFGLGIFAAVQAIDYDRWFRPVFLERTDITAGRTELWHIATRMIVRRPFFGFGTPQRIHILKPEGLVAHNSFLDLALTYGIIYSGCAFLAWFLVFAPTRSTYIRLDNVLFMQVLLLFIIVTAKSLVTNTFWTNMGDPVTLFVCLCLVACRYGRFRTLSTPSRSSQGT